MLFNSFTFLIFLLITLVIYYQIWLKKYQVATLIIASFFFYAWAYPFYLILLLSSATINISASYKVAGSVITSLRRRWAIAGVSLNLLILCFFKYSHLMFSNFLDPFSNVGSLLLFIPLPIGISFFSFEGITLVVDVFKEKRKEFVSIVPMPIIKHSENVLLFITFFPHLIAGPILKAHDFIPQISKKYFRDIQWEYCFKHLVLGYFLKMVVADNLKDQTFWISAPYFMAYSSFTLVVFLIGYSAQIFADFAGYSLIALGLAGMFGYKLEENFNYPYIARSFAEFWRRWHISLSTFLKQYLYIPLGGNRKGEGRTYLNLMITMLLGGLWHGAAWSYAIWGSFHGVALALERFLGKYITLPKWKLMKILQMTTVFAFVTLAWLLFKLPNFKDVLDYLNAIWINTGKDNNHNIITYIFIYTTPVFIFHFIYLLKKKRRFYYLFFKRFEYAWYGLLLFFIVTNSGASGSFIYFQF